jgi:hypothetical protein
MLGIQKLGIKSLLTPESKLKWIQAQSAGVDYLPLKTLQERQITVTNASGLKAVPIAQTVLGLYSPLCSWLKCLFYTKTLGAFYRSVFDE